MALENNKFTGIIDKCPAKHILGFKSCKKAKCPFATCDHPRLMRGSDDACDSSELFNLDHLLVKMPKCIFKYYPYHIRQEDIKNLYELAKHFNLRIDIGEGSDYHEKAVCVTISKNK